MVGKKKAPGDLLKQVPFFEGLNRNEMKSVLAQFHEQWYNAGEPIVRQGGPGGAFYLIVEGWAKVTVGGRSRGKLGPGEFFGEMSLIDGGPRSATIQADTQVKVLTMSSWNFQAILEEHWPITKKVLVELVRKVRDVDKSLTS